MSSAPDSGLPARSQHEAPLSAADASRLLDSIRQAEEQLAQTGEHIAVSPAAAIESNPVATATEAVTTVAPAAEPVRVAEESAATAGVQPVGAAWAVESADYAAESGVAEAAVVEESAESVFEAAVVAAEGFAVAEAESASGAADSGAPLLEFAAEVVVEVEPVPAAAEPAPAEPVEAAAESAPSGSGSTSDPDTDEFVAVTSGLTLPGDVVSDVETIVHVMRHGEVHNPKGILYGRLPGFQLSVTGRAQAQTVARSLADHDIALIVASPLQRAQETAEPIANGHGLAIRTDDNLIEAGNTFEGLRVSARDGALRKPRHWLKLRDPFTPSWGEPYLQIAHRMLAAVNKARTEAEGREAVLVSHQLPVWTLRRFLQGQRLWHDPRSRQCSLASLTSLVYQGDTLIDIVYSEPAGASDPAVTGA